MKTFSMTDTGAVREMNQDYIFTTDDVVGTLPNLLVVADGMGGHAAGDFASKYTVERVVELIRESEETDPHFLMQEVIAKANYELYQKAEENAELRGMGTTIVVATVIGRNLYVGNVGDSRLYVVNRKMNQITVDHSYVQEMVKKGELSARDARLHPQKNIITRAVGALQGVEVDCFRIKLDEDDEILMCTDGLTNMVEDDEILSILHTSRDIVEKVERLVTTANKNGGKDNISVVVADPFE